MKDLGILLIAILLNCAAGVSQETGYRFVMKSEVPSTPVKNQNLTSTCWSFAGISLIESEIIRNGMKQVDLSEMFIVREAYRKKAAEYLRRDGKCAFGPGGQFFDFLNISNEVGLVPDNAYPGLADGETIHDHDQMDSALKGYMKGILESTKSSNIWSAGLTGILDAYLGKAADGFIYEGKYYNPRSFAQEMGIDFRDYIVVSSFSDHPYYGEAVLEVPDNWAPCTYYNVPVDEMVEIIDNALMNGYSVAWASDMKGKGFSMKKGVALVPEAELNKVTDRDFEDIFSRPHPQKKIDQETRQKEFENHPITGDHGMHIIGIAEDQEGNVFYKVKNSWGRSGMYKGYIFVSREFLKLKTTNFMVNKNALPVHIAGKLGISEGWQNSAVAEGGISREAGKIEIPSNPVKDIPAAQ